MDGEEIIIAQMANMNRKIGNIIKLLKLALTLDDMEILKSTIESIIDQLDEIRKEK